MVADFACFAIFAAVKSRCGAISSIVSQKTNKAKTTPCCDWTLFYLFICAQIEAFRQIKNEHHETLLSNRRELQPTTGREILYVPVTE